METLGPDLNYSTETPRALGVRLAQDLDAESGLAGRIKDELNDWEALSIMDELGVLRRYVGLDQYELLDLAAKPAKASRSGAGDAGKTKTTFDLRTRQGRVLCPAAMGRLEIKIDRDFSNMDRARLGERLRR
jgi:ParB family chromosome partitioning protein